MLFKTSILPIRRQIFWVVLFLLVMGHVILFSATGILGVQRHQSEFYFITRQGLCSLLGIALMVGLSKVPYKIFAKLSLPLLALQFLLIGATHYGPFSHFALGAARWLKIGPFIFQPSELAKITLCVFVAKILAKYKNNPVPPKKMILPVFLVLSLLLLIFKQPDFGTTAILTVTLISMMFIAGLRMKYIISLFGVGALGVAYSLLHFEYRRKRLFAFMNPWADPLGAGFQTIQSFLSFHSGKIMGVGIGNGNSKLFYLPEVHTDFIFALVGEELGFIGASILLIAFIYLSYLLFKTVFETEDPFGCYLAFGLAMSLVLQIIVNLGGVTGLLPVKGLPLPFISWGRSALLVNMAMMGIILSIEKNTSEKKSTEPKTPSPNSFRVYPNTPQRA